MADGDEAARWLRQAMADLATARDTAVAHPYAACFFAQQAGEKSMKAVQLAASGTLARTHSLLRLRELAEDLGQRTQRSEAAHLDRLYTQTCYPDALADMVPAEFFTADDAAAAIEVADGIVAAARAALVAAGVLGPGEAETRPGDGTGPRAGGGT